MKQDHLPVPIVRAAMLIMPPGLLQGMIDILMQSMRHRHPDLFRNLARQNAAVIRIEPSDLPHQFALKFGQGPTSLALVGPQDHPGHACVKGKLGALLSLLEGRSDSDMLFFSREIEITGDTSVIVALRNTLDREEINLLDDTTALWGPLATPARMVAIFMGKTAERINNRIAGHYEEHRSDLANTRDAKLECDRPRAELQTKETRPAEFEIRQTDASRRPMTIPYLELVCPAGTLASLHAAIDAGADTVYCGFRDCTNARNYPGLNFDVDELVEGVAYAHERGCKVLVTINTFPRAGDEKPWHQAVDSAASAGADAVILADIGVLDYATRRHPSLRRHLSVQASAANPLSIAFYRDHFDVKRVVLPRVLSIEDVASLVRQTRMETEVFAFGSVGPMSEGRCFLSSYMTGLSPTSEGACAPASHVAYKDDGDCMRSCLGNVTLNQFAKNEPAAYPTPCKGRYVTHGSASYLFEEPIGLNAIDILPQLKAAGVTALKIEGRQRSRAYVTRVVSAFREALDDLAKGAPTATNDLKSVAEGGRETFGAYKKGWR
jgi:putative protease